MNVALRSESLNLISLCTGGGGLDLGVELAIPSARSVVLVEREAFACSHLVSAMQQGLMAEAALWSDVTTFNGRPWRGIVDGIIGGIPCQPHSLAGKRLGEEDERDLWSDARRILVQSGAWFVLIENVRGMLSSGGAERVWRDLQRLGFEVEGGLFTAAEVGASHERERIFILAVADARCLRDERWRGTGDILRQARATEGQGHQWQWHGNAVDDRGHNLADADSERLEGIGADAGAQGRPNERRSAGLRDGTALVHTERSERRADSLGRHELDGNNARRHQAASGLGEPGALVVNASRDGRGKGRSQSELRCGRGAVASPSRPMGHADSLGEREPNDQDGAISRRGAWDRAGWSSVRLFPPGPSDLSSWMRILENSPELEPAFRRVADGLASRLDIARVDRLRLLGNGVVSLEAAYAVRTLATRLAARGSIGAGRLVRMITSTMSSQQGNCK